MSAIFGPNSRRVLQLLTHIEDLSPEEIDRVADLWKQTSSQTRAEGWAEVRRTTTDEERYRILVAASVARRTALAAAQQYHRRDWAFWAAVWDAAAAVSVCDRIGSHYDVLIGPLAAVMPTLAHCRRDELSSSELQGAVLRRGGG